MRLLPFGVALGLAALAAIVPGRAGEPAPPYRFLELPQGVGCYWFRGRHYCSRYCYYEVDGHRYCQRRLRDAGSQAPILLYDAPPPPPPPPYGYRPVK